MSESDKSHSTINITSHNQMGGVTAHTVHVGKSVRTLSDELKSQILGELPRDKPITVTSVMGDSEACLLGEQIHAFLKDNGFPLKEPRGISQGVFVPMPRGLIVRPTKDDGLEFIVGANA